MQRLTSDKPVKEMTNMELAYNCCISQDKRAVYRDFSEPIDARELGRKLLDAYGVECFCIEKDEDFDELMLECLMDGVFTPSGLIAMFYRFIWSMADMRARLKAYEDTGLDPEQLYEMDNLYYEKCKELAVIKRENNQKAIEILNRICDECDEKKGGGWCGNCHYDEFIEALSIETSQSDLMIGDVLYLACYDSNFPEQSVVSESIVRDISMSGRVLVDDCETWVDWKDPEENMFLTREEAERRIEELIKKGER